MAIGGRESLPNPAPDFQLPPPNGKVCMPESADSPHKITQLLHDWRDGNRAAVMNCCYSSTPSYIDKQPAFVGRNARTIRFKLLRLFMKPT